jgi:hypothetical protein
MSIGGGIWWDAGVGGLGGMVGFIKHGGFSKRWWDPSNMVGSFKHGGVLQTWWDPFNDGGFFQTRLLLLPTFLHGGSIYFPLRIQLVLKRATLNNYYNFCHCHCPFLHNS